jgi:hypothetical protein
MFIFIGFFYKTKRNSGVKLDTERLKNKFTDEDGCLLGCCAMYSGTSLPTFKRCLLPPLSGRCPKFLPDYTAQQPRRQPLHTRRRENLKSHKFTDLLKYQAILFSVQCFVTISLVLYIARSIQMVKTKSRHCTSPWSVESIWIWFSRQPLTKTIEPENPINVR